MNERKKQYPHGDRGLLEMFKSKTFDRKEASEILERISDINQPILDADGYSSTYLFEAETCNNVEAVRFLLENGADPNYCNRDLLNSCALYDLHFLWEEMADEAAQRLEIAKLFFTFGADPNLWVDGEILYDHVAWEVSYGDIPHDRDYLCDLLKLLVAYGGGGGNSNYPKPEFTETIDIDRIDDYKIKLFTYDRYHFDAHMIDPDGKDIGEI